MPLPPLVLQQPVKLAAQRFSGGESGGWSSGFWRSRRVPEEKAQLLCHLLQPAPSRQAEKNPLMALLKSSMVHFRFRDVSSACLLDYSAAVPYFQCLCLFPAAWHWLRHESAFLHRTQKAPSIVSIWCIHQRPNDWGSLQIILHGTTSFSCGSTQCCYPVMQELTRGELITCCYWFFGLPWNDASHGSRRLIPSAGL